MILRNRSDQTKSDIVEYNNPFYKFNDIKFFLPFDISLYDFQTMTIDEFNVKGSKSPVWIRGRKNLEILYKFFQYYNNESLVVLQIFKDFQNKLKKLNIENKFFSAFINSEINMANLFFFRIGWNTIVDPHIDPSRTMTLNIGLKNSETHALHIYDKDETHSLSINDHDCYFFQSELLHSVKPIHELYIGKAHRYILSYGIDYLNRNESFPLENR